MFTPPEVSVVAPAPQRRVGAGSIILIEDERAIRRAVKKALSPLASRIIEAATGQAAIHLVATTRPALVVLDLALPDMDGADVCREIRRTSKVPILVLSARHAEEDKIHLLNAGADDYVTKPFGMRELEARVRVQLLRIIRHAPILEFPVFDAGTLRIDLNFNRISNAGVAVALTPLERNLLRTLVMNAGRTMTHRELFDAVWDRPFGKPQHYLRVLLTKLRREIEPDSSNPVLIVTEPSVGYRFEMPPADTIFPLSGQPPAPCERAHAATTRLPLARTADTSSAEGNTPRIRSSARPPAIK